MTTDLTRYLPGILGGDRLALRCTDCECDSPACRSWGHEFWTEGDAAEQVTELCLANLVAIAEVHEAEQHAKAGDALESLLDATCAPHAIVTTHSGLHWHVTHPAACDGLPYGEACLFDLARELRGYEQEPPSAGMFIGTPFVQHDHGGGECGHDCPVLIRWSAAT